MMRSVALVLGLASLLAPAVLTGCGESGGDRLSRSEFAAEADAICAKGREQVKALPRPTNYAELAAFISRALPIQEHDLGEIRKLKPPKGDEREVELMLDWVEQVDAAIDRVRAAAEKGDVAAVDRASAEARRADREATRRPERYGLKICGQPNL